MHSITAVIINFQTPDLTCQAVSSFRSAYPTIPLILIDNGSRDDSVTQLKKISEATAEHTRLIVNPDNHHHGPAMDQVMRMIDGDFAFFLDSDCIVKRSGFLERMREQLQADHRAYVTGKLIFMNQRGFDIAESPNAIPYIRPYCMMLKRDLYFSLPPFDKHGAPCLDNMKAAREQNLLAKHFPVDDFVLHKGRGTASRHGYQLGLRGKFNHLLNKLGL